MHAKNPLPTPLGNSYWVIPGKLLAGEYPRTNERPSSMLRLQAMVAAGMTLFIDLTTPQDHLEPYEDLLRELSKGWARRLSFGIHDVSVPSSRQLMADILDAIDQELAVGNGVYVHCWGGVGRTGTVIGCWLKRHGRSDLAELWKTNPKSSRKPESPETPEQRVYIESWTEPGRAGADVPDSDATMLARAQGALLGQVAGDSLGSLVEFRSAAEIRRQYPAGVRLLADGGTYNTLAGQPTDDSEMALLLARSLILEGTYKADAVLDRYIYWLQSDPFDCGNTISGSLRGRRMADSQANGALMRVSPIGIAGALLPLQTVAAWAEADASLTHPHPVCLQVNALYAMAIATAIREGPAPAELYRRMLDWAAERQVDEAVTRVLLAARQEPPADFKHQQGWVLLAFQNAVYQLLHAPSLEEGVVDTVMRGGDTDTNAAIAGALLGAVYGRAAIPAQWADAVLSCRPAEGRAGVHKPRPECFWPVDVLELAERLLRGVAQG